MAKSKPAPSKSVSPAKRSATRAQLTISSKNYSSWSLRGWLLCKLSGLDFEEKPVSAADPSTRAELLLLSPSFLVPCLTHGKVVVWDSLAIGEYLNEVRPEAGLLPGEIGARAQCRAISGEMHSGFINMRTALPMNLKGHHPNFKVWAGAQADIDRILAIWRDCFDRFGGPYLFGEAPCLADAMYAPVCTRFRTYDVKLDPACDRYCNTIYALPPMKIWIGDARKEPGEVEELDVEF